MQFSFKVQIDLSPIRAIKGAKERVERKLAEKVRTDTEQYAPALNKSLINRTRVEGSKIIYPGPYSQFLYYGKVMIDPETGSPFARPLATKVLTDRNLVFYKKVNSQAQAFWFEASKAQNKDKWVRVAQEAMNDELRKAK